MWKSLGEAALMLNLSDSSTNSAPSETLRCQRKSAVVGCKVTSRCRGGPSSLCLVHMGTKEAPAPAGCPTVATDPKVTENIQCAC